MSDVLSQAKSLQASNKHPSELSSNELSPIISEDMLLSAMQITQGDASLIGQSRAKKALSFGLGIQAKGYNIYVMGEQASGRTTLVNQFLEARAQTLPNADDICYLNNFDEERRPIVLRLPHGESKKLLKALESFIDEILATFPAIFENPSFQRKKTSIEREHERRYDKAIDKVESLSLAHNISLREEQGTVSFSPIVDNKILSDEAFAELGEDKRQHFYQLIDELESELNEALLEVPLWQREAAEKQRVLKRETTEQALRPLIRDLEHQYAQNIGVLKYLSKLKQHLIDTVMEILSEDSQNKEDKSEEYDKRAVLIETYVPNVLVNNAKTKGAPIIYESNPNYQNLFGKIEYTSVQGSVYTNSRMIVAGALHRANGGFLVLDVDKLFESPHVWEALKLALKNQAIKIDLPQQEMGMSNSITLSPQAIPLDLKVVLLGSRDLYYTLQDYDEDFSELFRVLVEFETEIDFTQEHLNQFVGATMQHANKLGIHALDKDVLLRLIEYSFRLSEHQDKLSARFADVLELINEAHYFYTQSGDERFEAPHIELALEAKLTRSGRASTSLMEEIKEGHVLINTSGLAVGKVNGLTVLEVGDTAFGTPARITSTVYAGANGVVDIEREVELGQSIHSKGVMLLTGYLGNKYAQSFPLTLSANIALEQSYGYIDGDSASLGELIALISALTDIPVNQGLAITGSINQYGEVQAVGGVNEKIEGFFDLCQMRGLDGTQGVIIPYSNKLNLVLKPTLMEAVARGAFNIYAVSQVDEAIELLMERPAGTLSSRGRYPRKSVHSLAVSRLYDIASIVNGGEEE